MAIPTTTKLFKYFLVIAYIVSDSMVGIFNSLIYLEKVFRKSLVLRRNKLISMFTLLIVSTNKKTIKNNLKKI